MIYRWKTYMEGVETESIDIKKLAMSENRLEQVNVPASSP